MASRRPVLRRGAVAVALVIAAVVAATAARAAGDGATLGSGTLNFQFVGPPISLSPVKGGNAESAIFTSLDYAPLIYLRWDGTYQPDLATSWHYVGKGNKVFDLTLRKGVVFADGSKLTAQAVQKSIVYYAKHPSGTTASLLAPLHTVKATGPYSLRLTFSQPDPNAEYLLSQQGMVGEVISPAGLANAGRLENASAGAGQYVYDASSSVSGSQYVYTANPRYWNKKIIRYAKIVVKIIPPPAVLNALKSGQVDIAGGSTSQAKAAANAGLRILAAPFGWFPLDLADRHGVLSKPLANVNVRRALEYAIDRKAILKATYGQYGEVQEEVASRGTDGFVPGDANLYPYNPAKAKQMLAKAGYPNGFTLSVIDSGLLDPNAILAQALAAQLAQIGVKLQITNVSTSINAFVAEITAKHYPAVVFPPLSQDMYASAQQILGPGTFNPFETHDAQVDALLAKAAAASGKQQQALYQQVTKRLDRLAWFVPVLAFRSVVFVNPHVHNVHLKGANASANPIGPTAADEWYTQ